MGGECLLVKEGNLERGAVTIGKMFFLHCLLSLVSEMKKSTLAEFLPPNRAEIC